MSCFCNTPRPICCCGGYGYGMRGPQGPVGPQGPAGPAFNQNATIYNGATQTITTGTPLTLPSVLTNNGLTTGTNSITVPTAGTYIVSYTANAATGATDTDNVGIAVNGTIETSTRSLLSPTRGVSGTYVLNLPANAVLTLAPTVTGATAINATGGPSATLTAVRVA